MKFPAGSYYIGDLCYALSDDLYEDHIIYNKPHPKICFSNTSYGDGSYYSLDFDFEFPVDAGIIGIAEISLCKKYDLNKKLGVVVEVKEEISFDDDGNGLFEIFIDGKEYVIDTRENEFTYCANCGNLIDEGSEYCSECEENFQIDESSNED